MKSKFPLALVSLFVISIIGLIIFCVVQSHSTTQRIFAGWKPFGEWIAFTCGYNQQLWMNELYVIRPDGSELTQITDDEFNDNFPVWSPDGEWIVFTSSQMNSGPGHLYKLHYTGKFSYQLTSGYAESQAVWSHDGRWIAYISVPEKGVASQVFRIGQYGENNQALTPLSASQSPGTIRQLPMWSFDDEWVSYQQFNRSPDNFELYRVHSDGSVLEPWSIDLPASSYLAWSPDGMMIAFAENPNLDNMPGPSNLYTLSLATGEKKQINQKPEPYGPFDWSPDGKWIVTTNPFNLIKINLDTHQTTLIADLPCAISRPKWFAYPD